MTTESKKRLALAIIDFLSTSLKDGTLSSEDAESVEVAQSCIAECFKVDPNDKAAIADAIGGQNLLSIYSVYEKLKGKNVGGAASGPKPAATAAKSAAPAEPTAEQKKEAETLKGQGNAAMAKKDYTTAISYYTKALEILPSNPIFLSNRAAAYSASHDHKKAMIDAQAAVDADPKYTKAWSRLGLAKFASGDVKGSMEAYQKGIEYEGNGGSDAMKKGYETAKKKLEEQSAADDDMDDMDDFGGSARGGPGAGAGGMPDLASLAGILGGGGGGGGGGMPDLGALMNNPMFASMAQNLMSNPSVMNDIMNNPRLREMADSFGGGGGGPGAGRGGGGMPDLASLMSDPSIAEMAKKYMGGAGGPGGGRGQGGAA